MAIEPNKEPDKVPPPKEQQPRPSYQTPPSKDFSKDVQRQNDRYPPDKEVVKELQKRSDAKPARASGVPGTFVCRVAETQVVGARWQFSLPVCGF